MKPVSDWISYNNLSYVDPEVLARVVNKLEGVNMMKTFLTALQMTTILTQSLVTTNLRWLNLDGNEQVEDELCKQAKQIIPYMTLGC